MFKFEKTKLRAAFFDSYQNMAGKKTTTNKLSDQVLNERILKKRWHEN